MTETKAAKKVRLKPLGNRVLVQRLEAEESLPGGIILPDSAKKKQEMAQVMAVGPGKNGMVSRPKKLSVESSKRER